MSPEEFHAHAMRAADAQGRLPLSRMTAWDVFPFEQAGLRVVPLAPPALPEPGRAAEMGLLMVAISRAIESLPHIARAHVSRWGDGGAHLHLFFFGRPAGFSQLRGTCLAIWDDLLPPVPDDQRDLDAATVGQALAGSYGGQAGIQAP
jgi:hypothetical protein